MELCEGDDRPRELPLQNIEKGKTVGKSLRMCRPLYGRGMVVIMDSGFCVVQALIELKKKGVFSSALIKRRRYWLRHIDGKEINMHMNTKDV